MRIVFNANGSILSCNILATTLHKLCIEVVVAMVRDPLSQLQSWRKAIERPLCAIVVFGAA
jgi:hypothetical protein